MGHTFGNSVHQLSWVYQDIANILLQFILGASGYEISQVDENISLGCEISPFSQKILI